MKLNLLAGITLILWMFAAAFVTEAAAQTSLIPGYGSSSEASTDTNQQEDLTAAIKAATEAGASVIVIDSAGQIVSSGGQQTAGTDAADAANPMGDGSQLMKAQEKFSKFRESMNSRLQALPYSIFEVQYVLRQTSPDGRIQTYVEVLAWNILFLLLGRWLSTEIYGKRIAKKLVVARSKEDPQGYREKMPFLVFRFVMGIGATIFAMLMALIVGYLFFGEAEDISIQFTVTAIFTAFFPVAHRL